MFCPKCGKINPDNAENCSGCNAVLHEEAPVPAKKKSIVKPLIAILAVAIVVAVVVIVLSGCGVPPEHMSF